MSLIQFLRSAISTLIFNVIVEKKFSPAILCQCLIKPTIKCPTPCAHLNFPFFSCVCILLALCCHIQQTEVKSVKSAPSPAGTPHRKTQNTWCQRQHKGRLSYTLDNCSRIFFTSMQFSFPLNQMYIIHCIYLYQMEVTQDNLLKQQK